MFNEHSESQMMKWVLVYFGKSLTADTCCLNIAPNTCELVTGVKATECSAITLKKLT